MPHSPVKIKRACLMVINRHKGNWRQDINILTPQAEAVGSIGVIRSLGSAGYRVHACSHDPKALGLRSNFASISVLCPAYSDPKFFEWLQSYILREKIHAIVLSEAFLFAIRKHFNMLRHLMPIPQDEELAYRPFSKIDVFQYLKKALGKKDFLRYMPPGFIIKRGDVLPSRDDLADIAGPYFIKSDRAYHFNNSEALLKRVDTSQSAFEEIVQGLNQFEAVLFQGWVGGMKAASAFCLHNNSLLAQSGVLGLRTYPHRGGMMSLRQSWHHEVLFKETLSWLRILQWHGVAMVECKWDPKTDRFWLIEINSRFYGYLHLDLYSGVDMPRIQMDAHFGKISTKIPSQQVDIQCRLVVPTDTGYLLSKFRDSSIRQSEKIISTLRFMLDFLNPLMRSDLLYPGDRKIYFMQWLQIFQVGLRKLFQFTKLKNLKTFFKGGKIT